jgi:putative two-component system response regulator
MKWEPTIPEKPGQSSFRRACVLCIDDSRSQLQVYRENLQDKYDVILAKTYEDAIAALTTDKPDIILLDMIMPQISGLEFLEVLRESSCFADIPVIIVSGDNDAEHVRSAFMKGAVDYIRKPYDCDELDLRISRLLRFVGTDRAKGRTEDDYAAAQALMIKSLADLATTRDNETGQHLTRIEKYVEVIARKAGKSPVFSGEIDDRFIESITSLAVLHDIGKVSVPDYILYKPQELTEQEFEIMKKHTTSGADTIRKIRLSFPDYAFLDNAEKIILYHHEWWDGSGYPSGLSGAEIPLQARIVALADVFDALTMKRVYKPALPLGEAIAIIESERGDHFDPDLIDVFLASTGDLESIYSDYQDND